MPKAKKLYPLIPAVGLLCGFGALAHAAPPEPHSPQDRIVRKFKLDNRLAAEKEESNLAGNTGCHQPLASDKDEMALYKDFRVIAKRGQMPDALLFVCSSTEGYAGAENIYSNPAQKTVHTTKGIAKFPQKTRRSLFGHEVTHIVNKDEIANPGGEIAAYNAFEAAVIEAMQRRKMQGNPVTQAELLPLVPQEQGLRQRAINALIDAQNQNHPKEETADQGGLILAAGKRCKIEPGPLLYGIETMYSTLPSWTSEGTYSHPKFLERKNDLNANASALVQSCREYYHPPKMRRPDKRPGPN